MASNLIQTSERGRIPGCATQNCADALPVKTIGLILLSWMILWLINNECLKAGLPLGTAEWFPIAHLYGITPHLRGIPYLISFFASLIVAYKYASRLSIVYLWILGLFMIISANLGQGGWDAAFFRPFYMGDIQYYHDAVKVDSWREWLASFNVSQSNLLTHSRTHPPFAVLAHYFLLNLCSGNVGALSISFIMISSLAMVLVWYIFKRLEVPLERRNMLAVVFAVIPAVNIFSAVCLDGVILSAATLFLLGLVSMLKAKNIDPVGLFCMFMGLTVTNLLTYGGVFLTGVAGLMGLWEIFINRRYHLAYSLTFSMIAFIFILVFLYHAYDYNHLQGFLTASALENPHGFSGFHMPVQYVATRLENICEIALFLSVGFLAYLFHPGKLGFSWMNWRDPAIGTMLCGLVTLAAIFLSGAYKTGETARATLFIYPYLMLTLARTDSKIIGNILLLAGLQTLEMQLLGNYFW